jgi:hypothetical protein
MQRWRNLLPVLLSALLVWWVIHRVSLDELKQAAYQVDWVPLSLLTAALVAACFLWDSFCIRWLFTQPESPLAYPTALAARGGSYLASVVNYEVGQGLLAWYLSRSQNLPLLTSIGRCVLLTFHDMTVLLALGLLGSLLSDEPRVRPIRIFCAAGLGGVMVLALALNLLPAARLRRWRATRWGAGFVGWNLIRSARLCLLRGVYFAIIIFYAATALPLCGVSLDYSLIGSVIPLVLLADGLPISASGLGTRENVLLLLLHPEPDARGTVLAFSLIWSSGLIIGRSAIGLFYLWLMPSVVR